MAREPLCREVFVTLCLLAAVVNTRFIQEDLMQKHQLIRNQFSLNHNIPVSTFIKLIQKFKNCNHEMMGVLGLLCAHCLG